VEETNARPSSRELNAGVHHQGSFQVHMEPCLLGHQLHIMSASEDGSIRRWIRDGEPVGEPGRSNGAEVVSMAVCPDESMVVSGSADGGLRLWNVKGSSVVGYPWEGHSASVKCLDWSHDEISSGSEDGTIRRWNPNIGR
jgi:WD40 repeat protein